MKTENENRVAIVNLGTELTQGFRPNTNAHRMAAVCATWASKSPTRLRSPTTRASGKKPGK